MRLLAAALALVAAGATTGTARDRAIPFQSVERGSYSVGAPVAPIPGIAIRAVNVAATRYVDVYAFAGTFPTGGYSVTIRRLTVTRSGRQLCVSAELSSPAPGSGVTQAFTQPWHRVRVKRHLLRPAVAKRWALLLDGQLVAASSGASARGCTARPA